MRILIPVLALAALGACAPKVPDSGVGFESYPDYLRERTERETALRTGAQRQTVLPPPRTARAEPPAAETVEPEFTAPEPVVPVTTAAATAVPEPVSDAATITTVAAAAIESAAAAEPVATPEPAAVAATVAAAPAPRRASDGSISDEQDFGAVSERETIESDAERIAANRQQYVVIEPTPVPQRSGSSAPNIVEYALTTTNSVGQPLYRRTKILAANRFNRNCAKYSTSDQAQEAFLSRGGPERDGMGIDPDGDGFACYWDPAPFRTVLQAGSGN